MRPYQPAHAAISAIITHVQTGIGPLDSARTGSKGSPALNALRSTRAFR